ncbi:hypothetical protein DVH24_024222 [Malus domestica]|uniref:RNase H type-1 domain-containing protein n=1 Tax=Malus domestica TaxID=3750 RepID=A0A498JFU2_MALDO|nr:hypothetical protein DVH24_024222 [Malus domestica]
MHGGLHNIILENDSFQIRNTIDRFVIGHIVEDSKAMMFGITGATANHAHRQASDAAHYRTRYALFFPCACVRFETYIC